MLREEPRDGAASARWQGQQQESESSEDSLSEFFAYFIKRNSLCGIRDTTRTHSHSLQRVTSVLLEELELSIKEMRGLHGEVMATTGVNLVNRIH